MLRRSLLRFALLVALAVPLGCAVPDTADVDSGAGYATPPAPPAMSAARLGLAPAYRAFYDALEGQGDWVLIEPYGWVFRPNVNFDAWRPYQRGWWEASDTFGWIWNSADDFGWVTDHYGSWFYDSYQGWVWQPGPVWGPAWVAWVGAGDYVGWAPLAPVAYTDYARVPGGPFTFAPAQTIGTTRAGVEALYVRTPPSTRDPVMEITNVARVNGVAFNRGPDPQQLQRMGAIVAPRGDDPAPRRVKLPALDAPAESDLLQRTRRALSWWSRTPQPPAPSNAPAVTPAPAGKPAPAPADSGAAGARDRRRADAPPGAPSRPGAPRDSTRR